MTTAVKYFAVASGDTFYALDVYPDEVERHRRSLRRFGDRVFGPFDTADEAFARARAEIERSMAVSQEGYLDP